MGSESKEQFSSDIRTGGKETCKTPKSKGLGITTCFVSKMWRMAHSSSTPIISTLGKLISKPTRPYREFKASLRYYIIIMCFKNPK